MAAIVQFKLRYDLSVTLLAVAFLFLFGLSSNIALAAGEEKQHPLITEAEHFFQTYTQSINSSKQSWLNLYDDKVQITVVVYSMALFFQTTFLVVHFMVRTNFGAVVLVLLRTKNDDGSSSTIVVRAASTGALRTVRRL